VDKFTELAKAWQTTARAAIMDHVTKVETHLKTDFVNLWRKTRIPVGHAIGEKLPHESAVRPDVASLVADHEETLAQLNAATVLQEALSPLFVRQRRNVLSCFAGAGLALFLALVGGFLHSLPILLTGIVLMAVLVSLAFKFRKSGAYSQQIKLDQCFEVTQKRIRKNADVALQKWLQRSFQQFSVNFKPLLDRCEQTRLQQDQRVTDSEALRSTFTELAKPLGK